jgi:chemotaxis protein methyltransferase CheR
MFEVSGSFAYRRPAQIPRPRLDLVVPPRAAAPPPKQKLPPSTSTSARSLPPVAAPQPAASPSGPGKRPRTPEERLAEIAGLLEQAQFPKALLAARRFSDEHPDDLAARLTLGNVHALMGDHELSRDAFHAALAQEPLCVEARLYLALAAMQANGFAEARVELTRALFLEPSLALGHYLLGQVCERLTELQAARRSYKNAMALKKTPQRALLGHYPELPGSADAVAQAAAYRVAALEER